MPSYRVGGISVQFPFDAYDCQLVYMERVIHSLQQVCPSTVPNKLPTVIPPQVFHMLPIGRAQQNLRNPAAGTSRTLVGQTLHAITIDLGSC